MPKAQLPEPLDHAAEKGGFKEVLAKVEAAVEADVEALLGSGRVDAQDFETLTQAVRLKRAGMRWTVAGANAIIALRCCVLSGCFEDFWQRRAANAA